MTTLLSTLLRVEGFDVRTAPNGEEGLTAARDFEPDVILLDIMMPHLDGFEVCRRLRSDAKTRYACVIVVTAKASSSDKVAGLRAGADDFVTKPFDPEELLERVRAALRRRREMTSMNPLTHLPGNDEIQKVVEGKLIADETFAFLHVDIDNFKAFNDRYGLVRGDDAILALAHTIGTAVEESAPGGAFVGHVGGDDMVVICAIDDAEALGASIIKGWDSVSAGLYDPEDALRGWIEASDRHDRTTTFPLMTLSVGLATTERDASNYHQISDIAARMKSLAKRTAGSCLKSDRREGELRENEQASPQPPDENAKLLIVDDNPMIREVLTLYCEAKGFTVFEAANGIEAYHAALEHRPRFVVLDFRMPELDGKYTAELIREAVPQAVVIALSAFLDSKPEWADVFIEKHQLSQLTTVLQQFQEPKSPEDENSEDENPLVKGAQRGA
jgi:DNA-binding response OmpR family regulator